MARALVQSTNFTSSVASERHGQLRGSGKTKRTVRMLCSLQGPTLRSRSFPGLRSNAFGTVVRPNLGFHSTTSSRWRGKARRFVPKATLFEHFTEKAIKAIVLAQEEARLLGHNFVGPEHFLLGLIGEGTGIAAEVLKSMGINLKDARVEVEKIIGRGSGFLAVDIPFTPQAKHVLLLSLGEASQFGHIYVGSEHLLLGLLREEEGVAARLLEKLGADPGNIRKQAIRMIGESTEAVGAGVGGGSSSIKMPQLEEFLTTYTELAEEKRREENGTNFTKLAEEGKLDPVEGFTEKAIKAITLAQAEPKRLGHNFVGTEQILLGLIGEGTGIAAKVLKSMGIHLKDARVEVEKIIGRGSGFVAVEIPFTPRAKRVLELSQVEARQLGHNYIGSAHLLLGLLRDSRGLAARVLVNLGADPGYIRPQVIRMIGESAED
ncbi:ATP-dependent Clp protease ATP-binding subunit ClpA homolog CD4A, chloroplastic-like [Rhododendron vialii]|uniref:ATP-dependent Clp protease ATP-binding subunit ClpA homolog CD4A, chloroplastic-like n=1 Tax=Rhododendron vialii TaxID=182163 RepID=UPI00265FE9C4|nr:ATP-dependent Clp protease ATP-binding subunit ClpA homolog CD4A, chloroplastic-like [Rhododendron vialii]XP_058226488.1 ATP-dependent Clp protease ATP-binding subunit ClpA homolog CD4A, chloroplastic-like [Rhododendron vialii]